MYSLYPMASTSNQSMNNSSKLHKLTKTELVDMVLKLQEENCIKKDKLKDSREFFENLSSLHIKLNEENKKLKDENFGLQEDKEIIGLKEATKCFQNLGGNWWSDERKCYSENFYDSDDEECDEDADNIPTEKLKDGNYRDLRVLYDFFNDLN